MLKLLVVSEPASSSPHPVWNLFEESDDDLLSFQPCHFDFAVFCPNITEAIASCNAGKTVGLLCFYGEGNTLKGVAFSLLQVATFTVEMVSNTYL